MTLDDTHSSTTTGTSSSSTSMVQTNGTISTQSNTTSPDAPAANGLGGGPIAGIAIGALVLGLVAGAIVVYFCMKKRRRPRSFESQPTTVQHHNFDYEQKTSSAAVSDTLPVSQFLVAPTPDKDLARELQSLGNLIQQHVEDRSFYHLNTVSIDEKSIQHALEELGQGANASKIAAFVLDPRTRYAALEHIISVAVFSSISVDGRGPISMLPTSIAASALEMAPTRQSGRNSEVDLFIQNRWRQMTVFLLHPSRGDRSPLVPRPETAQQAQQLAALINRFLVLFVTSQVVETQKNHLQDVIMECAKFGYVVLSQPGGMQFTFESSEYSLAIHPGLVAVCDEMGAKYKTPHTIAGPSVVAI